MFIEYFIPLIVPPHCYVAFLINATSKTWHRLVCRCNNAVCTRRLRECLPYKHRLKAIVVNVDILPAAAIRTSWTNATSHRGPSMWSITVVGANKSSWLHCQRSRMWSQSYDNLGMVRTMFRWRPCGAPGMAATIINRSTAGSRSLLLARTELVVCGMVLRGYLAQDHDCTVRKDRLIMRWDIACVNPCDLRVRSAT